MTKMKLNPYSILNTHKKGIKDLNVSENELCQHQGSIEIPPFWPPSKTKVEHPSMNASASVGVGSSIMCQGPCASDNRQTDLDMSYATGRSL